MGKTFGEMFDEALACRTRAQGEEWLSNYAQEIYEAYPENADSPRAASDMILYNIGYMTGYHGSKEANHIYKIFGVGHPVFGGAMITEGEE